MATRKAVRGGKHPLGKVVLSSGNANVLIFAASLGLAALGVVLAVAAVVVSWLLLIGTALCLVAGGLGAWFGFTGRAAIFELRTRGVRSVRRGEATEIPWEDVKRVVVQKSFLGKDHGVTRITHLDSGVIEYRGERVAYEFRIVGRGEKVVVKCGGKYPNPVPRKLLRKLEESVPGKVTVYEPDEDVYFDD